MRKKFLFYFFLLSSLTAALFAAGAKEAEDEEVLVQVLSVKAEDGFYSFETRTEDGNVVIYHTSGDTDSSYELSDIAAGDYLMVTDTGTMTMSLPPQAVAKTVRYVTPSVKNGLIEADFSAPVSFPGLSIAFGSPDEDDIYSLFSYSYGYLSMKSLMDQGVYPDGGYFAKAVLDVAGFGFVEPMMEFDAMDASIDEFIEEYLEKGIPTGYGDILTTLEEIEALDAPESLTERFSYGYGYLATLSLLYNGVDIYPEEFAAGTLAALYGTSVPFDESAMAGHINQYVNAMEAEYQAYVDELAAANLAMADAYLADNAQREGVKVLPTGVQVEFLQVEDEESDVKPLPTDTVTVNYRLTLLDGTIMDQGSYAQFSLMNLIPGFRDAVLEMSPGDIIVAVIPPDQGYGESGAGNIEPNSLLIFDINLISIDRD